jgi:hypothetical protein
MHQGIKGWKKLKIWKVHDIRRFNRFIGPGPGEPRRACESLKGSIALAIDVLFLFFIIILLYLKLFLVYLEQIIM